MLVEVYVLSGLARLSNDTTSLTGTSKKRYTVTSVTRRRMNTIVVGLWREQHHIYQSQVFAARPESMSGVRRLHRCRLPHRSIMAILQSLIEPSNFDRAVASGDQVRICLRHHRRQRCGQQGQIVLSWLEVSIAVTCSPLLLATPRW